MAEQPPDPSRMSNAADRGGIARDQEGDQLLYRGPLRTPRRYDQPIEDDDDPGMPVGDATLNTKI